MALICEGGSAQGKRLLRSASADSEHTAIYERLYAEQKALHDYFGRSTNVMKNKLKSIRGN